MGWYGVLTRPALLDFGDLGPVLLLNRMYCFCPVPGRRLNL